MLRVSSLSKRYKTGDEALRGVSFDLPAGQVVALIGPSGSGKSTLIRCINRLVKPTGGSIEFNGTDLTRLGGRGLRARAGTWA